MAVKLAGNQGKVMGVDLSYVEEIPGAQIARADIEDEFLVDEILDYFGRKVNAVICDLAPHVSGNWTIDHAKQISERKSSVQDEAEATCVWQYGKGGKKCGWQWLSDLQGGSRYDSDEDPEDKDVQAEYRGTESRAFCGYGKMHAMKMMTRLKAWRFVEIALNTKEVFKCI